MPESEPIPNESLDAGHEVRDVSPALIVMIAILLIFGALVLHSVLWRVEGQVVPESRIKGAAPPTVMPGEDPLNERLGEVESPRLEGLEQLDASPPSYRSSAPIPGGHAPDFRPEDLRASRQPALWEYRWVDREKGIARIPIGRAMDAVVEASRHKPEKGKK